LFAKGSVESTHKVPTSHYHTKHRTDGRCHRGRVARWTNTPARIFKDPAPGPHPPSQPHYIYRPRAGSSYNWPPRAPSKYDLSPVPGPWRTIVCSLEVRGLRARARARARVPCGQFSLVVSREILWLLANKSMSCKAQPRVQAVRWHMGRPGGWGLSATFAQQCDRLRCVALLVRACVRACVRVERRVNRTHPDNAPLGYCVTSRLRLRKMRKINRVAKIGSKKSSHRDAAAA
jgi:hypothetical protein